jgi:hypothetical protein
MQAAQSAARWLRSAASDALDRTVVSQLGGLRVEQPPVLDLSPVDIDRFWQESRISDPHHLRVAGAWECFQGQGWREFDLTGDSHGPGSHPGSRRLHATAHIGPAGESAPVVVVLHGYAVPFTWFDRWLAYRMRQRGVHTVRLELPFHVRRAVPGRHSGEHFFSLDPAYTRAVIRQCVEDTVAVTSWAQREVTPDVRLLGTSLGGLVALLVSALTPVDRTLAVAPFCEPPVTFTEQRSGAMRTYTSMLGEAAGYWGRDRESAREALSEALAPIVPRRLRPVTPPERITVVASQGDRIVGTPPMEDLVAAWGTPVWRYPHGHIAVMNAKGLPTRIVEHMTGAREAPPGELALAG